MIIKCGLGGATPDYSPVHVGLGVSHFLIVVCVSMIICFLSVFETDDYKMYTPSSVLILVLSKIAVLSVGVRLLAQSSISLYL